MDKLTADKIIEILAKTYPDAMPQLEFGSPYQLLVAVILSAQCTDKRVNIVTKELFKNHGTPQDMIKISQEELEAVIKPCGLFRSKASHILSATKDILEKFDGQVPQTVETLQTLAGVGRKTANVVYAVAFGGAAIAVDTHVFRVSNRIGLATASDVLNTEKQLNGLIDEDLWSKAHHYLIFHGRQLCSARSPKCNICPVSGLCRFYGQKED